MGLLCIFAYGLSALIRITTLSAQGDAHVLLLVRLSAVLLVISFAELALAGLPQAEVSNRNEVDLGEANLILWRVTFG